MCLNGVKNGRWCRGHSWDRLQLLKQDSRIPDGVFSWLLGRGRALRNSNTEIRTAVARSHDIYIDVIAQRWCRAEKSKSIVRTFPIMPLSGGSICCTTFSVVFFFYRKTKARKSNFLGGKLAIHPIKLVKSQSVKNTAHSVHPRYPSWYQWCESGTLSVLLWAEYPASFVKRPSAHPCICLNQWGQLPKAPDRPSAAACPWQSLFSNTSWGYSVCWKPQSALCHVLKIII